jgi:hypothetical protein
MGQSNSTPIEQTHSLEPEQTPVVEEKEEDTNCYLLFHDGTILGSTFTEQEAVQIVSKWKRNLMMKHISKLPDHGLRWEEDVIPYENHTTYKTTLTSTKRLFFLSYSYVEAEIGYVRVPQYDEENFTEDSESDVEEEEEEYKVESEEEYEDEYESEEEDQKKDN